MLLENWALKYVAIVLNQALRQFATKMKHLKSSVFLTMRMMTSWKQFWRLKQIKLFVKGGTKQRNYLFSKINSRWKTDSWQVAVTVNSKRLSEKYWVIIVLVYDHSSSERDLNIMKNVYGQTSFSLFRSLNSSVFCSSLGQFLKFQAKKSHLFPYIPIFDNF